jgi:flagellin
MGLRINTNVAALNTSRILRHNTLQLNKSLERLSSGLRINRAADDAAGLAIAEGFRSQVRGSRVAARNAQDRASLDLEVQQLLGHLDVIALDTNFNGVGVLSSAQTVTLQTGPQQGQTLLVAVSGARTSDLGVSGVSISSVAGAVGALSTVDAALQSINNLRAALGAQQNRLEFTIATLGIQEENASASESAIRDADIALETQSFTRNQILVSAGTTVLAQANIVPQTALQLLGG